MAAAADRMTRIAYGIAPSEGQVILMNGPMYHSAPNSYGMAAFRHGCSIVLEPRFDAEDLLALDDGLIAALSEEVENQNVAVTIRTHPDAIYAGAIGAAEPKGMEKCWGVAKAGQNDCGSNKTAHSCQGQSTKNYDPDDFKVVKAGTCAQMGGSLEQGKDADVLVLRVGERARTVDDVLSALLFDSDDLGVEAVYLRGRRLDVPRA